MKFKYSLCRHRPYEQRLTLDDFDNEVGQKRFRHLCSQITPHKRARLCNNLTTRACKYFLEKEEKKLEEKKIIREKSSKKDVFKVLKYLNFAFTINKNVKRDAYSYSDCDSCNGKGCEMCEFCGMTFDGVDYDLRDMCYRDKKNILIFCISQIQKKRLPIKYGKNDGILYFEYCGRQVSFHDPKNQIHCKKFNGKWSEKINKKIPFPYVF